MFWFPEAYTKKESQFSAESFPPQKKINNVTTYRSSDSNEILEPELTCHKNTFDLLFSHCNFQKVGLSPARKVFRATEYRESFSIE